MNRVLAIALLALTAVSCSTATRTIATTGKAAVKTVSIAGGVAGKTTKTAVVASGKVAGATVSATGSAVKATAGAAGSLAQTALVTFKDTTTGVTRQVPWTEGLKLYAAGQTAEVDMYLKAFQIVRQGGTQVIKSDWHQIRAGAPEPVLRPGDLVEVRPMRRAISAKRS